MPGYTKFQNHLAAYEPNFFFKRVPQSLPQFPEAPQEAARVPLLAKFIEAHRSLEEHKYVVPRFSRQQRSCFELLDSVGLDVQGIVECGQDEHDMAVVNGTIRPLVLTFILGEGNPYWLTGKP